MRFGDKLYLNIFLSFNCNLVPFFSVECKNFNLFYCLQLCLCRSQWQTDFVFITRCLLEAMVTDTNIWGHFYYLLVFFSIALLKPLKIRDTDNNCWLLYCHAQKIDKIWEEVRWTERMKERKKTIIILLTKSTVSLSCIRDQCWQWWCGSRMLYVCFIHFHFIFFYFLVILLSSFFFLYFVFVLEIVMPLSEFITSNPSSHKYNP